jgi:hypothetical protein
MAVFADGEGGGSILNTAKQRARSSVQLLIHDTAILEMSMNQLQ